MSWGSRGQPVNLRQYLVLIKEKQSRMKVIFFLILLSLLIAVGFLAAFFWAVRSGQYDDEYTPSVRMLFDDQTKDNNQL